MKAKPKPKAKGKSKTKAKAKGRPKAWSVQSSHVISQDFNFLVFKISVTYIS